MVAAGVWYSLDDEAIAKPGDVHLDAFDQTLAPRALMRSMCISNRFHKATRRCFKAPAADLVDGRRCRESVDWCFHGGEPQRTGAGAARSRVRWISGVGTMVGRCDGAALS